MRATASELTIESRTTARDDALVALREPSAFYCMRMWDRAVDRAVDMACRAGVPAAEANQVRADLDAEAARAGRGRDWVARQVRRSLYRLVAGL